MGYRGRTSNLDAPSKDRPPKATHEYQEQILPDNFPVIPFHQYGSDHPDDRLLLFAAPAVKLWAWAGVPRKGWKVRMLYQRWITESRQQEVVAFWNQASTSREDQARKYLVGPTAITIAILEEPVIEDGQICLAYEPPFEISDSIEEKLEKCAKVVTERMLSRLSSTEQEILNDSSQWNEEIIGYNYVLESLTQIKAASEDASAFRDCHNMSDSEVSELVSSLEALCRPALIVDGQHRLFGAAHSDADEIWLPAVAIPNSPWMEQIYQFVVINEKAKKVEPSLLTDIFGSSLTPNEQVEIRKQLANAGAQVDPRIAAVIAGRDPQSPFYDMVKIKLEGDPPGGNTGFIPELTIRNLIDGGRGTHGWRADQKFYDYFIRPTFPERTEWDSWANGIWRKYWFAFWQEVRDWYNAQAQEDSPLWCSVQTNLTKAVSLRMYQRLFIEKAIARLQGVEASRETLISVLGEALAEEKLQERIRDVAIPGNIEDFRVLVRDWFLNDGVPVRVFEYPWVSSLDDADGQEALYSEFDEAWEISRTTGRRYRAQNYRVFTTADR